MPSEKAAMPMRPRSRMRRVSMKPVALLAEQVRRPGCGSPRTPARRCPRSARRACPPSCPERKPFVPRSTMKAEMPFLPLLRSVTAMTTAMSARRPLVMKVLEPFSTQQSPSRTAVVLVPPASEPALFSVRPQQPSFSPRASGHQELLLLLLGAGQEDVARAEAVVRGHGEGHPGVRARQLLHHDRVVERGHARAAVLRRATPRP